MDNITESDELNNNMASPDKMVIGDDCIDLLGGVHKMMLVSVQMPVTTRLMLPIWEATSLAHTPDVWMVQTEMMSMHLTSLQVISWK